MPEQANNVTPVLATPQGYLTDKYDHTDAWNEFCAPKIDELFEFCRERNIPFFLVALHMLDPDGGTEGHVDSTMARAIHFPGPHRVPSRVALVGKIMEDPEFGAYMEEMAVLYAMKRFGREVDGNLGTFEA